MLSIRSAIQRLLPKSGFAKAVGMLVGGTAVAQAINIASLPVLTRLYTPDDFTVLAIYASLLSILSVVACLRLDIAIPMPEDEGEAVNLLKLSLIFTLCISLLIALTLWLYGEILLVKINRQAVVPYMWLLPIGVLFTGSYSGIQYWATRKKNFKGIAQTRMTQAVGGMGTQLALGFWAKFGPLGLLLGHMLTSGLGVLKLGRYALNSIRERQPKSSKVSLFGTLRKFERFPRYSTFEAFANVAAIQLPILIIGTMAIGPEAGFLMLAMKASALPLGLIGGAISQVYLSQAPEELRAGRLAEFTAGVVAKLVHVGVGPLLAIGILAPSLVGLVLGSEWARTGEIILLLMPWFIMQFLSSPISMALHVTGNQRLALANQIFSLVIRVGLTLVAVNWFRTNVVELYAISGFLSYFVYFVIVMRVAGVKVSLLASKIAKPILVTIIWAVVSLLFLALFYN